MERNFLSGGDSQKMPKSLERMLNVTREQTTAKVERSQLLDKLDAFLPKMREANAKLQRDDAHKINSVPAPQLMQKVRDAGDAAEQDDLDDEDLVVDMDVYLDETLGKIVSEDGARAPHIEEVDDAQANVARDAPVEDARQ